MDTVFETPDLTIAHDAATQWLHVTWRGRHPGRSSLACLAALLRAVRATGSTVILNDSTQDLDGWGELAQWVADDYFQALAASGVAVVAWVLPHNLRARADTDRVMLALKTAHATRPVVDTFADIESAYSWLRRLRTARLS